MGSSGSSNFSDYADAPRKPLPPKGARKGSTGGSSGENQCDLAFSTDLEDVALSDFFKNHKVVPTAGTKILIELRKRVVAVTNTGESVGNLPTKFNYLAGCMQAGYKYRGVVQFSVGGSLPKVTIDAGPL